MAIGKWRAASSRLRQEMAARAGCAFWPNDSAVNPSLPNLPYISQIRCESIFNGVKVVSLNDFDPVKRRDDGCERDGDHCDHCDDGDGFALSRIVFLRGWPHCWFFFLVRLSFWTNVASVQKHFRKTIYRWK